MVNWCAVVIHKMRDENPLSPALMRSGASSKD